MAVDVKARSQILENLQISLSEKDALISNYEDKEIYELAYLIKWQIVEETVKEIGKAQRKAQLLVRLNEWIEYLHTDSKRQPSKINSFSIDSDSIPNIDLILDYFANEDLINLRELLNSKGKYREKRNAIAHRFSRFKNQLFYNEFSVKVDDTLNELIDALSI